MSGKAKFRFLLLAGLLGLCGYVVFLVFQERDPQPPVKSGLALYKEGQELDKQGKFEAAAIAYDRANVMFQHAIDRLHSPLHGLAKAEVEELSGKALTFKAMAIRDKHFARAAAAGKPIAETRDTTTGTNFRNFYLIPDAKDRDEAIANMRGAGLFFLPKDYDVQVEVLRLELMSGNPQWNDIERACKGILETQPKDTRAKYLLAKFDFEQPSLVGNIPTPAKKRSPSRVNNALELIEEVRNDRNFPLWRTEFLRAQIHSWMFAHYSNNEKKQFEHLNILDNMLLDETVGATARIRRGEALANLSRWDVDAILGLHIGAVDIAIVKMRKQKEEVDPALMGRLFKDTLDFCKSKLDAKDPAFPSKNLISTILATMVEGQSFLSVNNKKIWLEGIKVLRPMLQAEEKAEQLETAHTAEFAGILMREAYLNRNNKDATIRNSLRAEARQWLATGMKYGKDHNLDNNQMLPFYLTAANVVYFAASPREEFEPYLHALQESRNPRAQATALLLDAAYDEFEGRLEKAHFKLEQVKKIPDGEESYRAHAALANIYMAMGKPDNALLALANLENIFQKWDELNNAEKEWMAQFLRSPEEFYAMLLVANLETARMNVNRYFRINRNAKNFPPSLVVDFEGRARDLLKRELPRQNAAGFKAHIAYVNYLLATRRVDWAEKAFDDLNRDFSDRFEMLALKIGIMQEKAKASGDPQLLRALRGDCDKVLKDFIVAHPNMSSAKLYYATYLAHTNRIEESLAYLKEMGENNLTPELKRVVWAIIMSHGQNANPLAIRQLMPRDSQIDDALLDLSKSIEDQQRNIRDSLLRHETLGLARLMAAEDTYHKGDLAKAADQYAKLLDFTRTKGVAQKGVIKSMFALAQKDPQKAADLLVTLLADYPREPVMLLCAAYVYLWTDNIGHNTDNFEVNRNMGSALNMWEKLMADQGSISPIEVPLTRAEYWFLANRVDTAREELQRALNATDGKNPGVLLASIMMTLDDPSKEPRSEIREYAEEVKRLMPDAATSYHVAARVEEFLNPNPQVAIGMYEQMLPKFPKDNVTYVRLIDLLDITGEYDRALKWTRVWRKEMPTSPQPITAEIRFLSRKNDLAAARAVASQFVDETDRRVQKLAEVYRDTDAKKQAERRALIVEDAHNIAEFEAARGFYIGGAIDEAQFRLARLPANVQKSRSVMELTGEIHAKKKEWDKAETVFAEMHKANPFDLMAANNYAYVLSEYRGQPEKAREVIHETLKAKNQRFTVRSADRFPPDFLATVGTIYVKLNQKALAKEMGDFFESAKERYPKDGRVYFYIGFSKELKGELGAATDNYKRAKNTAHLVLTREQRDSLLEQVGVAEGRVQAKLRDPSLLNK